MNKLTHSLARVNSLFPNPLNRYYNNKLSFSSPSLSFRQPKKTHTNHTFKTHTLKSTVTRRYTHRAMDSDSNLLSTEGDVTKEVVTSSRSLSSDDEQSVVVDANENEAEVTKVMTSDDVATKSNATFESSGDEEQSFVVVDANDNDERVIDHEAEGDERRELPEELWRSIVKLSCESSAEGGNCDVYLVGTAHVSMESCKEVEAVISFLKPQVVFLELCSGRVAVLTPQNLKVPTMGEMVDLWKKKHNAFGILYSWFLAKVASQLEVFPGSEFRVAYEEAMKYGGRVVLGDRPVNITLKRTWSRMPLWHKTKLMYSLIFQSIFLPSPLRLKEMLNELNDVDMLTLVIQEMSKEFPTMLETLVHERDQYMSSSLLKVAQENSSVVAVVGKGHLQGIQKYWKQPVEVRELLELPSAKPAISVMKVVSTAGVLVAGVAIVTGIYLSSKK